MVDIEMVIEKGVESVQFSNGWVMAEVKVKTENGVVGMRVSFELRNNPKLDALVELIDSAFQDVMTDSLGMVNAPKDYSFPDTAKA